MEYTTLGRTGVTVSRICLGTMSFGSGREWGFDKDGASELVDRAVDLGINFFDTANIYSKGESEEVLGDALEGYDQDWLTVSTKIHRQMDENNLNSEGLSRKAVQQEVRHSLDRLGMDTVDLLHIHTSDPATGIDVTLRTLDTLLQKEFTRYLAASSLWTHEFAEMLHTAEQLNVEPFTVMQNHYNIVYREEERDMLPLCRKHDIGVLPYSPLARGYVTRPHEKYEETRRGSNEQEDYDHTFHRGGGKEINHRIEELSEEYGVSMAQISLAWLFHKEVVDAPVIGVSSVEQLEDAVEALDVSLSDSDMKYLEEPYEPSEISGHAWPDDVIGHRH